MQVQERQRRSKLAGIISRYGFVRNRELSLRHEHDGRDLDLAYAEKTIRYLNQLWGRKVHLETGMEGKVKVLTCNQDPFQPNRLGRTVQSP